MADLGGRITAERVRGSTRRSGTHVHLPLEARPLAYEGSVHQRPIELCRLEIVDPEVCQWVCIWGWAAWAKKT